MTTFDVSVTIGDLVRQQPARSRLFESLKIDYCCGGKRSIWEVCRQHGLSVKQLWKKIDQCDQHEARHLGGLIDADAMSLSELADHIEQTHHAYLKDELPRLDRITEKVARVHGEHDPRLARVRQAFVALKDELVPHMMKEEIVLFPLVRKLESQPEQRDAHAAKLEMAIRQMEAEHDQAGDELAILREATDSFLPPHWACNTYRAMLDGLATLESDMHQHVHKENNVLFPKALRLRSSHDAQASG